MIVGADGIRSQIARSVGVARPARLAARTALTYHLADPAPELPRDARMRILPDGYIGIAPVPRGRVNVGIVLGPSWRAALHADGADQLAARLVSEIPATADDPASWRAGEPTDTVEGAAPVGHRVSAVAGPGWFLVGDAAGFLDPFTGEGSIGPSSRPSSPPTRSTDCAPAAVTPPALPRHTSTRCESGSGPRTGSAHWSSSSSAGRRSSSTPPAGWRARRPAREDEPGHGRPGPCRARPRPALPCRPAPTMSA